MNDLSFKLLLLFLFAIQFAFGCDYKSVGEVQTDIKVLHQSLNGASNITVWSGDYDALAKRDGQSLSKNEYKFLQSNSKPDLQR